ncbi:hypothetical protein HN51_002008 [Arachis hypogaea]
MVSNQKENGAFKRPTSKVVRPGAGKNPQGKKKTSLKIGLMPSNRQPKSKEKEALGTQTPTNDNIITYKKTCSSSKNLEIIAMKKEMLDNMRRLHQEKIEAYEAKRMANQILENHVVKEDFASLERRRSIFFCFCRK